MPKKVSPIDAALLEMHEDREADMAERLAYEEEQRAWQEEWEAFHNHQAQLDALAYDYDYYD